MKPVITGIVLIALCISQIGLAQNDTPMEVLVNIANENTRFTPTNVFQLDNRNTSYLDAYLRDYIPLKLNSEALDQIVEQGPDALYLEFPFKDDQLLKVKVVNHDIRAEGFEIVDIQNNQSLEIPEAQFYRGSMERTDDGMAGISFFRGEVYGVFSSKGLGNIVLVKDPIEPGNGSNFILYSENDLKIEREPHCAADHFRPLNDYLTSTRSKVYDSCDDVEVYVEATYQLVMEKGSSFQTSTYISAFFNNSAIIYRNEGIYTSLKRIGLNTSEDGYSGLTTSFDNLNKFGENTKNYYQQYGAELAHLVDYNETNLGGIAWINALCDNYYKLNYGNEIWHTGAYAYSSIESAASAFPDYSLTVFMFTHEMGHNLGSRHTQSCVWQGGPIDNCAPVENGSCNAGPNPPSTGGTIMSYCHNNPVGINFSAGFGSQPGNLIRTTVANESCEEAYVPSNVVACVPNQVISANRECTDIYDWTNYYFDNNTADESDDVLILAVKKEGENIGNLDDGTLTVKLLTSSNAGNGSTHIDNPGYNSGGDWHVMNRWFELDPTNEPQNPVTVRFPYTESDFSDVQSNQPEVTSHSELIFYKVNSPGDPNPDHGHESVSNGDINFYMNGTTPSLDTWKYVKNGSSHFAEFKVSSFSGGGGGFTENVQASLPVDLTSFNARLEGETVLLDWETAQELNNDFFTIERSEDGIVFEQIGKINGLGTSLESNRYEFLDRSPLKNWNYYRLSQTDFDGTTVYLGVRAIEVVKNRNVVISPNPLGENLLTVDYEAPSREEVSLQVRNIEGKVIFSSYFIASTGSNRVKVDLTQSKPGIYLVQVKSGHSITTSKLIKN